MAAANGGEMLGGKSINPFVQAGPDPDHPKYFNKNGDDSYSFTAAGNSIELLHYNNACKVMDVKPDAGEVKIDLWFDRGQAAQMQVVDADGKPLDGSTCRRPHGCQLGRISVAQEHGQRLRIAARQVA